MGRGCGGDGGVWEFWGVGDLSVFAGCCGKKTEKQFMLSYGLMRGLGIYDFACFCVCDEYVVYEGGNPVENCGVVCW